jgi:hypothetical protein
MSDVSLDVSQAAFKAVYNRVVPTISLPFDGSTSVGPIWIGVEAAIHVDGAGDITFEDSDTFFLKELNIGWDKLVLRLGFNIPPVHIGKFCLVRMPDDAPFLAGECLFEFPGGTLFGGNPDIGPITINLNAIIPYVVSQISGRFQISLEKDGGVLGLKAHAQSLAVAPIAISETFGKLPALIQAGIADAAASWIAVNPQAWLLDLALGILGFPTLGSLLLDLLDIGPDVQIWLTDKLNTSIGIQNLIYQAILDSVLDKTLFKIPDPYRFLPTIDANVSDYGGFTDPQPPGPTTTLAPPHGDILNPSAAFDADTLHIRFDLGV